jgi:hypothetical protein
MSIKVTGTLVRCDLRNEKDIYAHNRYSPNTERYVKFLDCQLQTDDGRTVYFQSPRTKWHVANGGPCAIVCFDDSVRDQATGQYVFPADHPWFQEQGTIRVATAERSADATLVSKWQAGDRITVSGRVKADRTSKAGKPYLVLNYIKVVA